MIYKTILVSLLTAVIAISFGYAIVSGVKLALYLYRKNKLIHQLKKLEGNYHPKIIWNDVTSMSFVMSPDRDPIYFKLIFQFEDPTCLVYANGNFFGVTAMKHTVEHIKAISGEYCYC